MSQITSMVHWWQANGTQVAEAIAALIGAASILVKLTPSQKDNEILAKIVAFISKYIALNTTKHT